MYRYSRSDLQSGCMLFNTIVTVVRSETMEQTINFGKLMRNVNSVRQVERSILVFMLTFR